MDAINTVYSHYNFTLFSEASQMMRNYPDEWSRPVGLSPRRVPPSPPVPPWPLCFMELLTGCRTCLAHHRCTRLTDLYNQQRCFVIVLDKHSIYGSILGSCVLPRNDWVPIYICRKGQFKDPVFIQFIVQIQDCY